MDKKEKKRKKKERKGGNNYVIDAIIRYALILLLSINSLFIFYYIFTPLTFYPVLFILKIFYNAAGNLASLLISMNGYSIELIDACIAGSAYFLLAALNLMTSNLTWIKRIGVFLFSAISLLILNILRIIILAVLLINNSGFFDAAHYIFWHLLSIVFVVVIWFIGVRIYRIKTIPLVSDVLYLRKLIRKR